MSTDRLAILGGQPVRQRAWPKWPRISPETERAVLRTLHSGRWTISGAYAGETSAEQRFAKAYAQYHDVPYCTPTTSGTGALTASMLALGVGPGDEVLVPGLTWVACASSVLAVGAVPVIVDIEEHSLAMCPQAAKAAITDRTKAMMVVHPFCTVAAIDDFVELSKSTGIPWIEDCAQAHGTAWKGQRVGTFGDVGCFSMQQSKLLTSGEGGAVLTRSRELFERLEQLRCDGRMFSPDVAREGRLEFIEVGSVQGRSLTMTEMQATLLFEGLKYMDEENAHRAARARTLDSMLDAVPGVQMLQTRPEVTARSFYNVVMRIDPEQFAGQPIGMVARALADELDTNVNPVYRPMNRHPLYQPLKAPRGNLSDEEWLRRDSSRFETPVAEKIHATCLTLTHPVLLDDDEGMQDIAKAFAKVQAHAADLANVVLDEATLRQSF